jgi:hypothetical protein
MLLCTSALSTLGSTGLDGRRVLATSKQRIHVTLPHQDRRSHHQISAGNTIGLNLSGTPERGPEHPKPFRVPGPFPRPVGPVWRAFICMNESCRSPWRSQSSWSCIGDDPTGLIESSLTTIALTVSCSDPPGTVLSTASMADYLSVLGPLVATPSAAILPMDGPESFLVVTSSSNRLPRISMACLHCRNR